MRRRELLGVLAGAATWPVTVRGQESSPIVGWLRPVSPKAYPETLDAFQQGLNELGFIESRNVNIEHRWSQGTYESLAPLAAELVQRRVAVIFTGGGAVTTLAAKAATSAIPIVFVAGDDPTRAGLVKNINRPESNVTGATLYAFDLELKKLELLGETVPQVATIAILRNPKAPEAESQAASVKAASVVLGRQIDIPSASTDSEIDAAFETLPGSHAGAVLVVNDVFFSVRSQQIIALARRYSVPAIFDLRHHVVTGGLMDSSPLAPLDAQQDRRRAVAA